MTTNKFLVLATCALTSVLASACSLEDGSELEQPRGALLYDLSEDEVELIHARYAPEDDYESFREHLVAPFDCTGFGDLCAQVGTQGAYLLTADMVDLALEGVSAVEIETHVDAQLEALAALAEDEDEAELEGFRAAGPWTTQTNGNYRLRVRNGITTPLFGDRRAWTEARTQKKSLGVWSNKSATQLCVNAGTNTQTQTITFHNPVSVESSDIEVRNPVNACSGSVKTKTVSTYHTRRNSGGGDETSWSYRIDANGCASAQINGLFFNRCASEYSNYF